MIQLQDQFSQAAPLALADAGSGSLAVAFGDELLLIWLSNTPSGGAPAWLMQGAWNDTGVWDDAAAWSDT